MGRPRADAKTFGSLAVHQARLANGLSVVVLPELLVPSLAYFTTYRVGSRNERPGITGISHLFEHMMFNGARKYGSKQFDRAVESNGGTSNAYTSHDVTTYFEVLPSDKLDLVLDLEVDRMRDLDLSDENLKSEREVVKEERRLRTDESPMGMLHEHLFATAFMAHSYHWPVIGWMADIDAIDVPDINDYFRTYYAPNNATVVIAGAVDPEETLAKVEAVMGALSAGPPIPHVVRSEPEQLGERRFIVKKEAQVVSLAMAFHGCDSSSPDLFATDVLQAALEDGDSSRLRRRLLLEEELVVHVDADFPWMLDPGLFCLYATVRPGVDPARVEAVLIEELERTASEPLGEIELRKVKNQLQADYWRRLKTNEGRADMLCSSAILLGSPEAFFDLPARYEAVTVEDVQRVASGLFRDTNRTVGVLQPLHEAASGSEDE